MRKYRRFIARMQMYRDGIRRACKKDGKRGQGRSYFAEHWREMRRNDGDK